MSVFVDTNILLRAIEVGDPMHEAAVRAVAGLLTAGEALVVTPQIVAEFWSVATRPRERNGIGLTPDAAGAELEQIHAFFTVLPESRDVYDIWRDLVTRHGVSGVAAHDARLVAAMKVHGITRILTFKRSDFARYPDVEVVDPQGF